MTKPSSRILFPVAAAVFSALLAGCAAERRGYTPTESEAIVAGTDLALEAAKQAEKREKEAAAERLRRKNRRTFLSETCYTSNPTSRDRAKAFEILLKGMEGEYASGGENPCL